MSWEVPDLEVTLTGNFKEKEGGGSEVTLKVYHRINGVTLLENHDLDKGLERFRQEMMKNRSGA